ncbi:hypothetical protein M0R45_003751 [Rubus argutus]|uniref:Uncharacterized protein n=1 Tax=Rubus argutus TaxID=59490 RepID=A0AAW1YIP2_RUBAR
MASFEGRVSYSSLPKIDKNNTQFRYVDDFIDAEWPVHEGGGGTSYPSASKLRSEIIHKFPLESEGFADGTGYDSSQEHCDFLENDRPPEVNLKNVLTGMIAIVTGRNKAPSVPLEQQQQQPTSNVSFLGAEKNGDTYLHSSVYTPSAPPLFDQLPLIIVHTKRFWRLNPPNGFVIVQQQFACSALLLSLP